MTIKKSKTVEISKDYKTLKISDLLNHILPELKILVQEKAISIQEPDLKDQDVIMHSEVNKVSTVLKNLISNAIKYTQETGAIIIGYVLHKNNFHQFSIKDNGRGISKEDIPHLFDQYYQVGENSPEGGFGIGLTICKEYIDRLAGTISVESTLGQGSTFYVNLPTSTEEKTSTLYQFPKSNTLSIPDLISFTSETQGSTYDILIVEDNKDFCKYLKSILDQDYHLKFVHNGRQALNALEQDMPSLIITDWMMQGMDGLSFVKHLKSKQAFIPIPILMLTARYLASDKLKALQIGIDDYMIKPIDAVQLKTRISHLLDSRIDSLGEPMSSNSIEDTIQTLSEADKKWLIDIEKITYPLINQYGLTLDDIAKAANISTQHLNRKIKSITGLTAKKYIQEIRYWEARKMLETKEYDSVKAIFLSIGFLDQKHFSRKFKERFGQYSSEYFPIP